jgi:hypothetical protein
MAPGKRRHDGRGRLRYLGSSEGVVKKIQVLFLTRHGSVL